MKEIHSTKNETIKQLKKLHQKKYRDQQKRYLIEGFHLVEEAAKQQSIEMIFVDDRGKQEWQTWLDEQSAVEEYYVSEEVLAALSDLPTPQGIIAVVKKIEPTAVDFSGAWLLLDNVQDPGNVGTMIRTADAAGFSGVILGKGTADIYSTKVLRSMQGSNFHLPILQAELSESIQQFQKQGGKVFGTELNKDAVDYRKAVPTKNCALILGNEGQGVAAEFLQMTDQNLYIPIYGQAESLNVGVAAGILMYRFAEAVV
ncbi:MULTISPECIES: TrmH family RNA methyltransferase [Enterococcus]|uniref:TrmH family RNA methyltransferase n=1 Tax=Enterococcus TaxID=1350 RepID=UPI00065DC6E3|nr:MULTISPECIES: RNA methyltransferase [Enterococcus]